MANSEQAALILSRAIAQALALLIPEPLPAVVAPARYVTIALAALRTGYTVRAIERKIEEGVWVEGAEYVRAPDGRVLVDVEGYERWASRRPTARQRAAR